MSEKKNIIMIGSDAGGTMTDMFLLNEEGNFVVGKASTTPHNESIGFRESLIDAYEYWGGDWEKEAKHILPHLEVAVYSGTAMLNALLTRSGSKVGVIITKGFEDYLIMQRGAEIHAGYSYADKFHKVSHIHPEPLVPRRLTVGVTERVTLFGEELVPLYEHEVREAAAYFLDEEVESIAICFLYSYLDPTHEMRAAEIVRKVTKDQGRDVSIYTSSEMAPIWREASRLNAVILQAYAADRAREQLNIIEKQLQDEGCPVPLQIALADGGIANITYPLLYKAYFSGPVGGLKGGVYLSTEMGMPNIVCCDMGGTSFDVGLIMGGQPIMLREVEIGRSILNVPTLLMDSIGAGTGQYVTIDPNSKRIDIGPNSAGADPGPVCYDMGNATPTVCDCYLINGILNPDYYLGGKLKLRKDLALEAIKKKCSDPLGVSPYGFAEGVIDVLNTRLNRHVDTVLSVRGYTPADYTLLAYGGAGPLFLDGFTRGTPFKGIFTVPWAAAFSAFGVTCSDVLHRYQMSTSISLPPGVDTSTKLSMGNVLNGVWENLEARAQQEMIEEGFDKGAVRFNRIAYVRYSGQLEDVEVFYPKERIETSEDMDRLLQIFEETYSKIYTHAGRYPEAGFQILEAGLQAIIPRRKPELRRYPVEGKAPPAEAVKEGREVYVRGQWKTAKVYDMDALNPGNEVSGLAIIEAPATTFPVFEGRKVVVDEYKRFWLEEDRK